MNRNLEREKREILTMVWLGYLNKKVHEAGLITDSEFIKMSSYFNLKN